MQIPIHARRAASFRVLMYAAVLIVAGCPAAASAQSIQSMGAVATRDARVSGGLEVVGDVARLLSNASVTAYDRPAPVALNRGGHVLVCSTSEFHLLRSGGSGALIFGLDRGALEIFSDTRPQDVVLTPDLKLTPVTPGALDLRLRVTAEGDTCIDNEGAKAPVLNVSDPFSPAIYRVLPGQHLMFVKGDLRRVVDHERSPCGCPAAAPLPMIAGKPVTQSQGAAANHPFPQAQSQGLAPITPAANAAASESPGTPGTQVSTSFSYEDGQGSPPSAGPQPLAPANIAMPPANTATPPAPSSQEGGFFHAIGHFFKRLFHPS